LFFFVEATEVLLEDFFKRCVEDRWSLVLVILVLLILFAMVFLLIGLYFF
jgi:hypothetical protein